MRHDKIHLDLQLIRRPFLVLSILAAAFTAYAVRPHSAAGLVAATVIQSTGATGDTPTPTDNDYTRINNAIQGAASGDTIQLIGDFDWTEANAAASWALGSDGMASTTDDYSILVPPSLNNVTLTALSFGDATIEGPGDLSGVDLEAVLIFDGGPNQGWTISNLRFVNFDLTIAMFEGAGGAAAFNNTKITNNYIRVATDLNASAAPADVSQNIGVHFSFGMNQTISNNTIDIGGNGTSDSGGGAFATSVGMQSNASSGAVYDGLLIDNNTIQVLNAQSSDPEVVLGIWENGGAHTSNITVSNNFFVNVDDSNDASSNLQRAFRVTSHSSNTTTVTYSGSFVSGANIGFQWLSGSDFSGNQPVQLVSNNLTNSNTDVLIQSNGLAHLTGNTLANAGGAGTGVSIKSGSSATIDDANASNSIMGCLTGIDDDGGTATIKSNIILGNTTGVLIQNGGLATLHFNRIVGNTTAGVNNTTGGSIDAENNWWGCNSPLGCGATSGTVDVNPALQLTITAAPNSVSIGGTSQIAARLSVNSDLVSTLGLGYVPNGTPVAFGSARGTIAPVGAGTINALASAIFTGQCGVGPGSASATVDNQAVSAPITVTNTQPPTLTCPGNIVTGAAPGQCSAAVGYTVTFTDSCPGANLFCNPAAGSTFPMGTTLVSCTLTDPSTTLQCSFNVTVNDLTPPTIVCSQNIFAMPPNPTDGSVVVNYATPAAVDNCSGVNIVCSPPSGSAFPRGVSPVTCTATDSSSNSAQCSFSVAVFSTCIQDDATHNVLFFDTTTGQYLFTECGAKGLKLSGIGKLSKTLCTIDLSDNRADRRVTASINSCQRSGSGSVQIVSPARTFTLTDRKTIDDTCSCP